jgi:hypothetical protein
MPEANYSYANGMNRLAGQTADIAKKAQESISQTAINIKQRTEGLGRAAVNTFEKNRISAAGSLHAAATSLHGNADKLPNVPDLARSAANKVDAVASYLHGHDTKQMIGDVEAFLRRNPGRSLLAAVTVGFLIGRALRNN